MQLDNALCSICATIDVRSLFVSPVSAEPIELGSWKEVTDRSACCKLCRIISTSVRNGPRNLKGRLEPSDDLLLTSKLTGAHHCSGYEYDEPKRTFRLQVVTEDFEDAGDLLLHGDDAHLLGQEPLFHGRSLLSSEIHTGLVKSWISECRASHPLCESKSVLQYLQIALPQDSMLIDVQRQCLITDPAPDSVYAALSYKWGDSEQFLSTSDQLEKLKVAGYLGNCNLPQTVGDAIALTRDIGMQYLWIDALCIVQDVPTLVQAQIQQMHRIYSGATVTIVAASSEHADDGLFGNEERGRVVDQCETTIDGIRLLARQCFLNVTMNRAGYSKRAWTHQESCLSRRLLYVTSKGVTLHCCQSMRSEEFVFEDCSCSVLQCTSHTNYFDSSQRNLWREFIIGRKSVGTKPQDCECFLKEQERFTRGQLPYRPYGEIKAINRPIQQKDVACSACIEFQRGIAAGVHMYKDLVRSYTHRQTRLEVDRAHAFTGIIHLLASITNEIPAFGCLETYLDLSLLWRPAQNRTEPCRIGQLGQYPSWSWLSHEIAVHYPNDAWFTSEVDWHCMDETGQVRPVKSMKYMGNHAPLRDGFRHAITEDDLLLNGVTSSKDEPFETLYGWCQISTSFYVKDLLLFDVDKQPVDGEWNPLMYSECIPQANSGFMSVELCLISRSNHSDLDPYTRLRNKDWKLEEHRINLLAIAATRSGQNKHYKRIAVISMVNVAAWKQAEKTWRLVNLK